MKTKKETLEVVVESHKTQITWRGVIFEVCITQNLFETSGTYQVTASDQENADYILWIGTAGFSGFSLAILDIADLEFAAPDQDYRKACGSGRFLYNHKSYFDPYPKELYPLLYKYLGKEKRNFVNITKLEKGS